MHGDSAYVEGSFSFILPQHTIFSLQKGGFIRFALMELSGLAGSFALGLRTSTRATHSESHELPPANAQRQ
jgi:hypothetical protein